MSVSPRREHQNQGSRLSKVNENSLRKRNENSLSFLNRFLMDLASILESKSNRLRTESDLDFQHRALEAPKTLPGPSQDAPRTSPRRSKTPQRAALASSLESFCSPRRSQDLPNSHLASILEPFCSPRRSQDPPNSHSAYILEAFGSQDDPFDEIWFP